MVVISIIALLIFILLPALQSAKRSVKVLLCMNNLKQIGTGLHTYVSDDPDYQYPPPVSAGTGDTVVYEVVTWQQGYNGFDPDRRVIYKEVAGGRPGELFFCPLRKISPETYNLRETEYSNDFLVNGDSVNTHLIIYQMFILNVLYNFDFSETTNPDIDGDGVRDGPCRPGDSDAMVISDFNGSAPGYDRWQSHPGRSSHNGTADNIQLMFLPLKESNAMYGDGHVEAKARLENRVLRIGPPAYNDY